MMCFMRKMTLFFLFFGLTVLGGCSSSESDAPPLLSNEEGPSPLLQIHQVYLENYLYAPEELPTSLSGFSGPSDYVNFVNNQRPENDRFSSYLEPEAFASFNEVIFQERALIGIQFTPHEGIISESNPLLMESIRVFSRAYYDGLQAGDRLLEVDGIPISGMTFEQVRELLPTFENEPVILKILRGASEFFFTTSSENSVELVLDPVQGIGYISLRTFSDDSLTFILSDIQALQSQGV
ncbi:MAG: PDZ domain-containing protein, partial [Planctomycetota bacterium]